MPFSVFFLLIFAPVNFPILDNGFDGDDIGSAML